MSQYRVKLVQHEWVPTEVFEPGDTTVFETPPETEQDAIDAAQKFVDEHKELEGREYRLEAEEVVEQAPAPIDTVENAEPATSETPEVPAK